MLNDSKLQYICYSLPHSGEFLTTYRGMPSTFMPITKTTSCALVVRARLIHLDNNFKQELFTMADYTCPPRNSLDDAGVNNVYC
jgi:hypothetical protein